MSREQYELMHFCVVTAMTFEDDLRENNKVALQEIEISQTISILK